MDVRYELSNELKNKSTGTRFRYNDKSFISI